MSITTDEMKDLIDQLTLSKKGVERDLVMAKIKAQMNLRAKETDRRITEEKKKSGIPYDPFNLVKDKFKSKIPGALTNINSPSSATSSSLGPLPNTSVASQTQAAIQGIWQQIRPGTNCVPYNGFGQKALGGPPYSNGQAWDSYIQDSVLVNPLNPLEDLMCFLFTAEQMREYIESLPDHTVVSSVDSPNYLDPVYYGSKEDKEIKEERDEKPVFVGNLRNVFSSKMRIKLTNLLLSKQVLKLKF